MRGQRLLTLSVVLGLVVWGCEEKKTATEPTGPAEQTETLETNKIGKEAVMGVTLQWFGHASFKLCHEDTIIYIDPWKSKADPHDSTLILVSHSHYDHYSAEDVTKVCGPNTKLIASSDVVAKEGKGEAIKPGQTIKAGGICVNGVASYNPNKRFHPKEKNWLGFVIEIAGKRIYYAGDTDITEEMKALKDIDLALLPVGGTYTMNAAEAAEATKHFKPKIAIPYHWGDIVGSEKDAKKFAELSPCEVKISKPGEMFSLE